MEMPLTDRQEEVMEFVGKFIGENNYPPTIEEIQEGVGLSNPGSVYSALSGIEKKGYIKRKKNENRNIRLTETGQKFLPENEQENG